MSDSAVRELLRDAFTRLIEHVDELTDGLTDDEANYRPSPSANSIAWLIWHSARVQDFQLAPIAGVEQVWKTGGWVDRFGLDLPRNDTGYGHGPEWWTGFVSTLRMFGYDSVLSIEHEDSLLSPEEGLTKAAEFLNRIVIREQAAAAWWV